MLPYENVYSLENGALIKNTENKIEYVLENGTKRVKTNPTYKDFAMVGKYPIKDGCISPSELAEASPPPSSDGGKGEIVGYKIEGGYIVPVYKDNETEEEKV